jgi:signal transduction histidine kinase
MNDACSLVSQVLDMEFVSVLELASARESMLLVAGVGWWEGSLGIQVAGTGKESQEGFALQADDPVVMENLAQETRFSPAPFHVQHGVVSGITVAIRGHGRQFGVLGAHSAQRREFINDDIHFVQSIADVLATAIERSRLEAEMLEFVRREQRRIGQDLHDGLCQHLSGVAFRADALAADLASQPNIQAEVQALAALIRSGNQQARKLARGLAPVGIEANGLMSALEELTAQSAQLYRTDCCFRCEKTFLLANHESATHIYRIAQEAISNAVRHARPTQIVVELRHLSDEGMLTITNDGLSFPGNPAPGGGMGLQIMQHRAEIIGATLRVYSTSDGRTAVACKFPTDR